MKHSLFILCLFVCLEISTAHIRVVGQGKSTATRNEKQQNEEDLVHLGDVIDVDVVGGFEYDWRGTLNPEGYLDDLKAISEPIFALCRSEGAIADDVARAYSKFLRAPKIIIRILDRSNRAVVRLDGAIKTPTRFRIMRAVHLRELIVMAGGLTDSASGSVSIFRPKNLSCRPVSAEGDRGMPAIPEQSNGLQTLDIKISELLSGKREADPLILSGDMIMVTLAPPVYVIGAVNNPRPIYAHGDISLVRAIASAGGLAKDADGEHVSIFRRDGTETRIIEADLGKIKRGESIDEILKPFDILDVASKGGGKRKFPPLAITTGDRDRSRTELPLKVVD